MMYDLHNLVKDSTCNKNPGKPSYTIFILTNVSNSFKKTQNLETGFSDFHKLTFNVLSRHFEKSKPKIVVYKDYKNFS